VTSFSWLVSITAVAVSSLIAGCASTTVETTGATLEQPICKLGDPPRLTAVYWEPQWRIDQKEPQLRETLALHGIEDFFFHTNCLAVTGIHRLRPGDAVPTEAEFLQLAAGSALIPDRAVLIVVRELGPRLVVGLPVVVEGGTEVLIEVRVLDTRTSKWMANARTLWRNGGMFVIKGVKTLEQDMSAALTATLMPDLSNK
jgi:hypothetical protein